MGKRHPQLGVTGLPVDRSPGFKEPLAWCSGICLCCKVGSKAAAGGQGLTAQ